MELLKNRYFKVGTYESTCVKCAIDLQHFCACYVLYVYIVTAIGIHSYILFIHYGNNIMQGRR